MKIHFAVGIRHSGFLFFRNKWLFIVIGVMEILNILYYCEVFLYLLFREDMKVYFTVGSRHSEFVILRNYRMFILMGVV